ncbi:MAG TPA: ribose 5-phosphate isomerase B [Gemmatimonadales bacterium]|nr:ribose 5-phosphate isomerase B [Gemmatimonadales bacterium]
MPGKRAITEADVREAARAGRTLDLPAGAVVTPAARDLAGALGVALREAAGTDARTRGGTVAIGADHGGFPLKEQLKSVIAESGYQVLDLGTSDVQAVDYPDFAVAVARAVAEGRAWRGIMIDGAGIGSAMAANKVAGVRAALCHDITTAQNAREHNDANVLTLGGTLIGTRLAVDIVRTFLSAAFGGGRHAKRVEKINALDAGRG